MKLIYIIFLFSLISCSVIKDSFTPGLSKETKKELREKERCNKKFNKIIKQCPALLQETIVDVTIPIVVDSQVVSQKFDQNKDVSGLDSIISRYKGLLKNSEDLSDSLNSALFNAMVSDVKRYVINRPCLPEKIYIDTVITIMIDGEQYKIPLQIHAQSDNEGRISLGMVTAKTKFKGIATVKVPIAKEVDFTFKEKAFRIWGQIWWWIVIAVIILLAWRFGKNLIKKALHF